MSDTRPIGFFDSGVGGLSVLIEVQKILPKENIIFIADQKNIPYGAKSEKDLKIICSKITAALIKKNIKLLIVACNTATCFALSHLRSEFNIPIIGVVPAIKPAVKISKNKKIAVLTTPATSNSKYLNDLIKKFAKGKKILKVSCSGLEDHIENLNRQNIKQQLAQYSKKIIEFGADVVVLGCTHYPLIKKDFEKSLKKSITVIDSSRAIANQINTILNKSNSLSNKKIKDTFLTTGNASSFSTISSIFLGKKIFAQNIIL